MKTVDRSKLLLAAGSAAFLVAACQSIATAQPVAPATTTAARTYKNIQVLAPEITREQLFPIMKNFSQALGVRCTHCHVGEEGKPATFDFASDTKKEKLVARAMLRMVHRINSTDFNVEQFSDVKVTCFTCHRGATKPLTAPPPPNAPAS